ncbi:MAG: GNAT family N-acetyltransferase [Gemmatimonadota bacterium]
MSVIPVAVMKVAVHDSLVHSLPEIRYVFRALAHTAGYALDLRWHGDSGGSCHVSYAPRGAHVPAATITIDADEGPLADVWGVLPVACTTIDGVGCLQFGSEPFAFSRDESGALHLRGDIVRSAFWLLAGAGEPLQRRDRHGSALLTGSFTSANDLLERPLVSEYALVLRGELERQGLRPMLPEWASDGRSAFVFSHDVDYPQMIRWIECLRLVRARGPAALSGIRAVMSGASHFWKFDDWVTLEREWGARPAFYFSARRGSLVQYASGTPDCFYDIEAREFRELFQRLVDAGCEVGLHASYNAYRNAATISAERASLARASGTAVEGNRHHYFRLDPRAPHETLARHEEVGLLYDSSLHHAWHPGFRSGICHPFHPWHPVERRELGIAQLPPAWMDDHFDRCLRYNGITDADATARKLLDATRRTAGVAVVDYHVRGLNTDFFPRYGAWLIEFARANFDDRLRFLRPIDVARQQLEHERRLESAGIDRTAGTKLHAVRVERTNIAVQELRVENESLWEAYVARNPEATVYHGLPWKRVTEEGLGHRARYLLALDRSLDDEVVGVLPLFEVRALDGRALVSVPLRDRGGPLARDAMVAQALAEASVKLAHSIGARRVAIKFPPEGLRAALTSAGFVEQRHWVTSVVPVAMGEDRLWNDVFRSPTRRAVNKARNSGLVARWSTDTADLARFYEMFLMTRRMLGVPAYPPRFFEAVWKHLTPGGNVRLLLVEREGSVQGALLVFPWGREVVSAYMGSDPTSRDARVNDLLFWEAIRWSAESGYETWYFGADSPLQEGLLAYKRKWGGRQFVVSNYHYSTNGAAYQPADSSSPGHAKTRRLISSLPLPLFRVFGSFTSRRLW